MQRHVTVVLYNVSSKQRGLYWWDIAGLSSRWKLLEYLILVWPNFHVIQNVVDENKNNNNFA